MRISIQKRIACIFTGNRRCSGLTLVETMVTMTVGMLMLAGLITTMVFIMRQDQLVESKLGANDQSRRAFDQMTMDIRKSKIFNVGEGNQTTFVADASGTAQDGNALKLHFSTDTNNYVVYYFTTSTVSGVTSVSLRRRTNTSSYTVVAGDLTNGPTFREEDHLGQLRTNALYKYVIRVKLEFRQYQYPLTQVGPGFLYDYYKLEFRVSPHCPDGA